MIGSETGQARVITPGMWGPELAVVEGTGSCRELVGPRMGVGLRSMYHLRLGRCSSTIEFVHTDEAVWYIVEGEIEVASSSAATRAVLTGGMFHVRPGTDYVIHTADGAVLVGGPSPADPDFGRPANEHALPTGGSDIGMSLHHRDEPGLMVPMISADARLVVWYGTGAVRANMNYVVLESGERNKEHLHRYSEDTIYILEGRGTAEDVSHGIRLPFGPGDTVTIPPKVVHAVAADRGMRVVSVGGPCPADLDMLRAVGVDVEALSEEIAGP